MNTTMILLVMCDTPQKAFPVISAESNGSGQIHPTFEVLSFHLYSGSATARLLSEYVVCKYVPPAIIRMNLVL